MSFPTPLRRRFEALVFDWDGTAVPDRHADAGELREKVESLCSRGMDLAIVSGTNVDNVDGQLQARPAGPGRLLLALNRGSELFEVGPDGPELVWRRQATAEEEAALTAAAERAQSRFAERGLCVEVVASRLNRRKLDLIPEPAWADPPKARIAALVDAVSARLRAVGIDGLREAVQIVIDAAAEAGLAAPRVTSDAKHVEIGLTDKSDSARQVAERLWSSGIGPSLVVVCGDEMGPLGGLPGSDALLLVPELVRATAVSVGPEPAGVPPGVVHLGGGPARFLALLDDQLRRRRFGEVPSLDEAAGWTISIEGVDPELERVHETLLTLADGRIGTSGSPLRSCRIATPAVLAAGVYRGEGPETELATLPVWARIAGSLPERPVLRRTLDLHTGMLTEILAGGAEGYSSLRFSSLARPGTAVLRAVGDSVQAEPLAPEPSAPVAVAVHDTEAAGHLDRIAVYTSFSDHEQHRSSLEQARSSGFERLLREHRRAWAERWEDCDIVIEGDEELQLAVRLALFHLLASVSESGEAAVGARGLSGIAYRGHVFWDADVFVLPFLAATRPAAARAMLEYRIRRLDAAREAARRLGRRGARFPWESAADGFDVTPTFARDRTGRTIPILTGQLEEHIVADVAWASEWYADWSGDEAYRSGPGRELLVETARYWASRATFDDQGRAHIEGVIGPDEYHVNVDDNAYTNVMARWNLRRAAAAVLKAGSAGPLADEAAEWLRLASALVDGYDPATGLYEQHAGFFALEPLVIAEVAPRRPISAEALLGHERVEGAQVLKQADTLLLYLLVPEEVEPGSLEPNLAFYEPRTAHGSSLSPGIHAALLARVRSFDRALAALRLTSRIDLDDLTGTTAGGLHLAAMGSLWQALVLGFAGIGLSRGELTVDPKLPDAWSRLEVRLRLRGSRVRVTIEHGSVTIRADRPLEVSVSGRRLRAGANGTTVPWLNRRSEPSVSS